MDWLTFISNVIDSLAWPSVVVVILFLLRKELPNIAKLIRKFKYGDLEVEFGESAKVVKEKSATALPEPSPNARLSGGSLQEQRDRLSFLSELAPRSAILESWLQIESSAVDLIRKKGLDSFRSLPGPTRLRDHLRNTGILNEEQLLVFEELRKLRNEAVHSIDAAFDIEAVTNYVDSALVMAAYLEGKANEL
jgi:hypothetical protein